MAHHVRRQAHVRGFPPTSIGWICPARTVDQRLMVDVVAVLPEICRQPFERSGRFLRRTAVPVPHPPGAITRLGGDAGRQVTGAAQPRQRLRQCRFHVLELTLSDQHVPLVAVDLLPVPGTSLPATRVLLATAAIAATTAVGRQYTAPVQPVVPDVQRA